QQLEYDQKLADQKDLLEKEINESARKNIANEFENKIKMLETSNKENEEKLKLGRQKELEFLKKEQELKTKEEELEIVLQRKLQEAREGLA
ncbi:MAG TPA: DUF2130 domain-containing protein, partial [Sphingobacteriaceae bacterium]|nr:DUF2130 domain-containing protein [Sphingobacteriaceae bacterium]